MNELIRPCPICNNQKDVKIKYKLADYTVAYCGFCDFNFTNTELMENTVLFDGTGFFSEGGAYERCEKILLEKSYADIKIIQKYLKTGSILDVGCGFGYFIKAAKDNGWDVTGVDYSGFNVKHVKDKYKLPAYQTSAYELKYLDKKYDVVTLYNVIEHIVSPVQAIKEIKDVLNLNGWLVIECPASDSMMHKFIRLLYVLSFGLIRYPLNIIYNRDHVNGFSKKAISKLLECNGFRVVDVQGVRTILKEIVIKIYLIGGIRRIIVIPIVFLVFVIQFLTGFSNRMRVIAQKT